MPATSRGCGIISTSTTSPIFIALLHTLSPQLATNCRNTYGMMRCTTHTFQIPDQARRRVLAPVAALENSRPVEDGHGPGVDPLLVPNRVLVLLGQGGQLPAAQVERPLDPHTAQQEPTANTSPGDGTLAPCTLASVCLMHYPTPGAALASEGMAPRAVCAPWRAW